MLHVYIYFTYFISFFFYINKVKGTQGKKAVSGTFGAEAIAVCQCGLPPRFQTQLGPNMKHSVSSVFTHFVCSYRCKCICCVVPRPEPVTISRPVCHYSHSEKSNAQYLHSKNMSKK